MRARHPLSQPFAKRRRALDTHGAAALTGETVAIHQARVASRRLREVLPLVALALPGDEADALRRRMRRVTRALGPVREADVTLGLTIEHREAQPSEAPALLLVEAALAHEREQRFAKATRDLDPEKLAKWIARAAELEQALAETPDARPWRKELASRLRSRAKQLLAAIEDAGLLFTSDRLHEVRIAVKRLRYVLELADELKLSRLRTQVNELKGVQDILGHLHDLDILVLHVQEAAGAKQTTKLARQGLEAVSLRLENERRAAHAEYLAHRLRLAQLADTVADELAARVGASTPVAQEPASARSTAKKTAAKNTAAKKTAKKAAAKKTAAKKTAGKRAAATPRATASAGSAVSAANAARPTRRRAASSAPRSTRRRPS